MPINQQTPGLPAVIRAAIDARMVEVHTHLVGHIESYDPAKCRATVQLELRQAHYAEDGARVPAQVPPLVNVPVMFAGGGGSRLTFPVKRGDQCWVEFCEASLDRWDERGGDVDPADDRRHHLSDAVCWVGITDKSRAKPAHATAAVLEGADVRLGDSATAALLALKSDVQALTTYLRKQFDGTLGHVHATPSGPTTTITEGAGGGTPGTAPAPAGTVNTRAK